MIEPSGIFTQKYRTSKPVIETFFFSSRMSSASHCTPLVQNHVSQMLTAFALLLLFFFQSLHHPRRTKSASTSTKSNEANKRHQHITTIAWISDKMKSRRHAEETRAKGSFSLWLRSIRAQPKNNVYLLQRVSIVTSKTAKGQKVPAGINPHQ